LLMDRLQALNYQLDIRTSATFTYPEFDKTLFANVPPSVMTTADEALPPWQRDRLNTDGLLQFLEQRTPSQPFMTFLFFESTHAPYSFPAENALLADYQDDLDYTRMSRAALAENITPLFNRYHNAANWIDVQLGRIYDKLAEENLLANTIVIVTGDHGEEFMEHGAWGHNSSFVEQQTHVPLLMHVPDNAVRVVDATTTHLDIATTLLQELGAQGSTESFSLGSSIFATRQRPYIVLSDWHSISVQTAHLKYRIPYLTAGNDYWKPTDEADRLLSDSEASLLVTQQQALLLEAMTRTSLFLDEDPTEQEPSHR
jgi:membrane-anchored protein YejM (alkaline phosphatase superfamily)